MKLRVIIPAVLVAVAAYYVWKYDLLQRKYLIIAPLLFRKHFILPFTLPIVPHKQVVWKSASNRLQRDPNVAAYAKELPNILLIIADDLGFNDLSGGCGVPTPNIDSLRQNGLEFTQAYAGQATCAPSRGAMLTGRFSTRFGYEFTPGPPGMARILTIPKKGDIIDPIMHEHLVKELPSMSNMVLPIDETLMAEVMQSGGYDTYYMGKWDCGDHHPYTPMDRGYNESLTFSRGASTYHRDGHPDLVNGYGNQFDDFLRLALRYHISHNNQVWMEPDKYMTDYLAEQASILIKSHKPSGKAAPVDPFFLTLAFNAPHNPYQAMRSDYEDPEVQKLPTEMARVYAAMMKALDRGVGEVIHALKDSNQYDNTIVIFTSDNGGAHYAGLPKLNAPFRGWKGTLFEGGIHVPLFMQWPALIKPPSCARSDSQQCEHVKVNDPVSHVDLFTTFASLVRAPGAPLSKDPSKPKVLDGINLLDLVREVQRKVDLHQFADTANGFDPTSGDPSEIGFGFEDAVHINQTHHRAATRIIFWRSGHYSAVRVGDWKLQIALRPNKVWFYNLASDPTEHHNLAPEVGVTTQETLQELTDRKNRDGIERDLEGETSAFIVRNLLRVHGDMVAMQTQQSKALWPAVSETPVTIDKVFNDKQEPGDEYVHWPN